MRRYMYETTREDLNPIPEEPERACSIFLQQGMVHWRLYKTADPLLWEDGPAHAGMLAPS